jgi:hypothetical protein
MISFIRSLRCNLRFRRIRKDLIRLGVGDFVVKHASNTREQRSLLTVNLIGILGSGATATEQDAVQKVLAAIIYVEQGDGWAFTIGTLGTLLGEIEDDVVRKVINETFDQVERNFIRVRPEESKPFLEMVRIARTGNFDAIQAFEMRNQA